jgi:hypothetical protein
VCTAVFTDRAYFEFVVKELQLEMITFSEIVMLVIMKMYGC